MTRTFRNVLADPPVLADAIAIGATTATLATDPGDEMPTTGPFSITIDDEVFTGASRAGTALTLGNPATAAHAIGAAVGHLYGRADMEAMVQTDDSRLTDARTPAAHAASHATAGSDPLGLTKADVGLGNVDNTSDANKPVSSATQTALDAKLDDSQLDTDVTLAANSDTKIASQKATKAYVVNQRHLEPVQAVANALTINPADAPADIDGVASPGRYLIINDGTTDGIYDWDGVEHSTMTRAADHAMLAETGGASVRVLGGTYIACLFQQAIVGSTAGSGSEYWLEQIFMDIGATGAVSAGSGTFTSLTVGDLDIAGFYNLVQSADVAYTSTSLAESTDLKIANVLAGIYTFDAMIYFKSDATTNGIKWGFGTGGSIDWLRYGYESNCLATRPASVSSANDATQTIPDVTATPTEYWIHMMGTFSLPSNLGAASMRFKFACEQATKTTTTLKGSRLLITPTTI